MGERFVALLLTHRMAFEFIQDVFSGHFRNLLGTKSKILSSIRQYYSIT
jgi:hypothetical protein